MTDTVGTIGDTQDSDNPFILKFSTALANELISAYPLRLNDIGADTLSLEIQTLMDSLLPTEVLLSTTRPDFDNVLLRLMEALEKTNAWKDTTLQSTGQMFLRAIATDIDLAQFSIMRALQECYPSTARNDSSIFTNARDQGISIQRNTPANRLVQFTRQDIGLSYEIPLWTQFNTDIASWFNRDPIHWGENDISVIATLSEGRLYTETVQSTGQPFQTIEFGQENGKISDTDVRVIVDGTEWTLTESSFWNIGVDAQVFWQNTLPNGDVEIRFGDGNYGVAPPSGVNIQIIWAETNGADGNDPRVGVPVEWSGAPSTVSIAGVTTTPANDGNNALSVDYYRIFSGDRRGADAGNAKRAVLRKDFRAHACCYPGVADALIRGQAELNPTKRSWTNVIGVTLLTDPVFTTSQWNDFVTYMQGVDDQSNGGLCLKNLHLLRMDPTPLTVNFSGTLGISPEGDSDTVKSRVLNLLSLVLKPKLGTLGYGFYLTDFTNILRGYLPPQFADIVDAKSLRIYDLPSLVEFVQLDSPTTDILPANPLQWVKMGTFNFNTVQINRGNFNGPGA